MNPIKFCGCFYSKRFSSFRCWFDECWPTGWRNSIVTCRRFWVDKQVRFHQIEDAKLVFNSVFDVSSNEKIFMPFSVTFVSSWLKKKCLESATSASNEMTSQPNFTGERAKWAKRKIQFNAVACNNGMFYFLISIKLMHTKHMTECVSGASLNYCWCGCTPSNHITSECNILFTPAFRWKSQSAATANVCYFRCFVVNIQ